LMLNMFHIPQRKDSCVLIHGKFSLKLVSVEGVSLIVDSDEAVRIKSKYPNAKVKGLRRKGRKKQLNGPVRSIPVGEYLAQQGQ
jgi:hypothetical protein